MRHHFLRAALGGVTGGGGGGTDADADALFAARDAVGDPTSTEYQEAITQWVLDLKAVSGLWDGIIQLWTCAGSTTAVGAAISIKGNNLSNVGGAFVDADINPKTGCVGDGSTKYWTTGYSGTVSGTGQNDFHTYAYFTAMGEGGRILYGTGSTVAGTWNQRADGSSRNRSNGSDSATAGGPGGYGANRSSSGSYQRMIEGSVATITRTSQTPASTSYSILNGGTSGSGVRSDGRVLIYAMGPAIATLADYNAPTSDFITALNAI